MNRWLQGWVPALFAAVTVLFADSLFAQEADRDGDGLSDFHEQHKYLTDPENPDSDGDGKPDGDWRERREYQYTVRSVVQVMRPVTIEFLNDDYQDVRLLDEAEHYVELEVIHYPFNTVASAIVADPHWRESVRNPQLGLQPWLEAGPTADWTPELQQEIVAALRSDGIDPATLDDRETAETISRWLLQRAAYQDGFSCFSTAFDEQGQPFVPHELADFVGGDSELTPQQQWEIEISAAGMFRNRQRGSCSSSAIYLNGCLRAVGLPTRTVLCIPLVDANDEHEINMLQRLKQSGVRRALLGAIQPLRGSWASHTFNEVWVGGRWRRLNYDQLGQNIYDPGLFGLMTHVATFRDWADARMSDTIGRRALPEFKDHPFDGPNPYSTISLRDEVGAHCTIDLPAAEPVVLTVKALRWTDSAELPEGIRENCARNGRFGLIADVSGFDDPQEVAGILAQADLRVFMEPVSDTLTESSAVRLGVGFDAGCYWLNDDLLRIYVPFGAGDRADLLEEVDYRFQPRNRNPDYRWQSADDLLIRRKRS